MTIETMPFNMVYGFDAILPLEFQVPMLRVAQKIGWTVHEPSNNVEELKKLDETIFQNKDNKDLITGLKILYAKKKVPEKFIVSHEVACLLGTLIHDERIYQLIEKKKGATNMSDHVLGIRKCRLY